MDVRGVSRAPKRLPASGNLLVSMAKPYIDHGAKQNAALTAMLKVLGDRAAGSSGFYQDDPAFGQVGEETWTALANKGYVRIVDFMGGRPVCFLTGSGWKKALISSGVSQSKDYMLRVETVEKNLSDRAHGQESPVRVAIEQVAAETGVPEGFVWNLIESGVLGSGAPFLASHSEPPYLIEVPANYRPEVVNNGRGVTGK